MRVLICRQAGVAVAGIVCSGMGKSGIYLLGATSDNGLKAKGAYLLQWAMIKWLRENGYWYYDLGGIDPVANPGVYHFKSGLSGQEVCRLAAIEACGNPLSWLGVRILDRLRHGHKGGLRWANLRAQAARASVDYNCPKSVPAV